jgi:hypothetical protein
MKFFTASVNAIIIQIYMIYWAFAYFSNFINWVTFLFYQELKSYIHNHHSVYGVIKKYSTVISQVSYCMEDLFTSVILYFELCN